MRSHLVPLALLLGAAVAPAQTRWSLGVAPAGVRGNQAPSDLSVQIGRVVAEVLSWELSLLPSLRLEDPASLQDAFETLYRDGIDAEELQVASEQRGQHGLDALFVPDIRVETGEASIAVGCAVRSTGTAPVVVEATARPQDVFPALRATMVRLADSLRIPLPPELVQRWRALPGVPWGAVLAYAETMRLEDENRLDEAVARCREADRRGASSLPAFVVRKKRLEARTGNLSR